MGWHKPMIRQLDMGLKLTMDMPNFSLTSSPIASDTVFRWLDGTVVIFCLFTQ